MRRFSLLLGFPLRVSRKASCGIARVRIRVRVVCSWRLFPQAPCRKRRREKKKIIPRRNCPPYRINMSDAGKAPPRSPVRRIPNSLWPKCDENVSLFLECKSRFSLGIARFMTACVSTSRLIFNLLPTNEPYLPAAFL